jgi:hypothetical protein
VEKQWTRAKKVTGAIKAASTGHSCSQVESADFYSLMKAAVSYCFTGFCSINKLLQQ